MGFTVSEALARLILACGESEYHSRTVWWKNSVHLKVAVGKEGGEEGKEKGKRTL